MKLSKLAAISLLLLTLAACSLSPQIGDSSAEYNSMLANYGDQVLLNAIMRARDYAPINIANLSTVNGSMSFQGGIANSNFVTDVFNKAMATNTIGPMLQGTSAPTWSMAPLNTQGFTLNIIQPISPMYLVSKWRGGTDREFLLLLFIKSIAYRGQEALNNPDSWEDTQKFLTVINAMIKDRVQVKALTVLEPVGVPFDPTSVTQLATDSSDPTKKTTTTNQTNQTMASLLAGFQFLTGLQDTAYHVGNACGKYVAENEDNVACTSDLTENDATKKKGTSSFSALRLYRQYPSQVVLCANKAVLEPIYTPVKGAAELAFAEMSAASAVLAAAKKPGGNPSVSSTGSGNNNQKAGSNTSSSSSPSSGGAQPAITPILQANRVGAILSHEDCAFDQLVQKETTEELFQKETRYFTHVEWRSIAEIIQYLGAIVRNAPRQELSWSKKEKELLVGGIRRGLQSVTHTYCSILHKFPRCLQEGRHSLGPRRTRAPPMGSTTPTRCCANNAGTTV